MSNLLKSAAALTLVLAAGAAAVAGPYKPPRFDGRVGHVRFTNTSRYPVTVTLWHPDNGEVFDSWRVAPGDSVYLAEDGRAINVGSDWGVQLGDSKVKPLSKVSYWAKDADEPYFDVSIGSFF